MEQLKDKSNVDYPKDSFPYGSIRDKVLGVQDGTPVNTNVYSDTHQFFNKLLDVANIKPNGSLDSGENGFQLIQALASFMVKVLKPSVFESFDSSRPEADFDIDWKSACYGGGYFYRCGLNTSNSFAYISRSIDGINHEIVFEEDLGGLGIEDICYGVNGTLMATSSIIGNALFSDDYGVSWTSKSTGTPTLMDNGVKVVHQELGKWLFIGSDSPNNRSSVCYTEDNLDTNTVFNVDAFPGNFIAVSVAELDGVFVVVGNDGVVPFIYNSTDLITWNLTLSGGTGNYVQVISYVGNDSYFDYSASLTYEAKKGFFVLFNDGGDGVVLRLSFDAAFSFASPLETETYKSLAYGNGKLVVIGEGATSGRNIAQSFNLTPSFEYVNSVLSGVTNIMKVVYCDGKFILTSQSARTPIFQ